MSEAVAKRVDALPQLKLDFCLRRTSVEDHARPLPADRKDQGARQDVRRHLNPQFSCGRIDALVRTPALLLPLELQVPGCAWNRLPN